MYWNLCRCKMKCTSKFTDDEKKLIFSKLYDGKPKNEQDTFLQGLIEAKPVARRRKRIVDQNKIQPKTAVFHYFIKKNEERLPVCKQAFMNLYAISHFRVQRLTLLLNRGESPKDMRGKHNNRPSSVTAESRNKIKSHIESFPYKISHYATKEVRYLNSKLNVKSMFELFIKKYPELDKIVKYEFYLQYFKENFSLRFGRPQVDVCSECERLGTKLRNVNLNDNAKRVCAAELIVHKRRANKFYSKLKEVEELSKKHPHILGITFDYMQNLPLPVLPVQEIFYLRQLWVYCFEIHNLKTDAGHFYMYHEGEALKGPNEVCTFLNDYIKNHIPQEVQELHIFSDSCPGQNKNNTMVRFLMAIQSSKRFKVIYHHFPIRGHSFLPCDRDFGSAKRIIRRCHRVYIPEEYEAMIKSSRKKVPFTITVVSHKDVVNFKNWWPQFFKKTCKVVINKTTENFTISKYMQFVYDSSLPGYVKCCDFIDGAISYTFKLLKQNLRPNIPSDNAYLEPLPINAKKIKDVKQVMKYIEGEQLEFYYHIISWPTTNMDDGNDVAP